jgi:hypothetical protein
VSGTIFFHHPTSIFLAFSGFTLSPINRFTPENNHFLSDHLKKSVWDHFNGTFEPYFLKPVIPSRFRTTSSRILKHQQNKNYGSQNQ